MKLWGLRKVPPIVREECVLGTDRFRSYDAERFSQMDMQKCMSHIVKNLSEVLEKKRGRARSFCEGLKNSL